MTQVFSKFLKSVSFICLTVFLIACQQEKEIHINATYKEPIDPIPTNVDEWSKLEEGMQVSVASTYIRFVRNQIPKIEQNKTWSGEAWKGERISGQFVLWSNDSETIVETTFSDFISQNGDKLSASIAQSRFVKYVITDEFGGGCGYRKPEDFASSLAADALDNINSYAVKAKETRPVWITIDVPSNAKPGTYTSNLKIQIQGQRNQNVSLILKVIPKTLPVPSNWKFHLDLWQNPYAVARFHKVEPWSDKHWELLRPLMKNLADAGQKVITVSLNKRPWGGQTYDQFEAMVVWKKKIDGTWEYDYSIFDKWVEFMLDLGIKNQISCYSMVPWGNEFYYFDENQNKEIKVKATPGSKEYEQLWIPFLKQFKKHIAEKGWSAITRIAMDERKPKEMKAMLELLDNHAPEFGTSFADNHKSYKLYPNQVKDLSVAFGTTIENDDLLFRKKNGYISTHYVCCTDNFPNVFTFSAPAEGVFIGWYTIAAGFDGFLRWAYNSWVENPLQDSRFRAWPAGDTYLVYPDARSSIRFETLREGIQDAEKIRILRLEFIKENNLKKLGQLNKLIAQFNITKKPTNLEILLKSAKKELNQLAIK